jgi:nucleotide-binding universal stress UspA family protein
MFKKILIATDGSDVAKRARTAALDVAAGCGAEVHMRGAIIAACLILLGIAISFSKRGSIAEESTRGPVLTGEVGGNVLAGSFRRRFNRVFRS